MYDRESDRRAREVIRRDLGETLVVEAAAGTGKTTSLVSRIIEVIRSGNGVLSQMVAVTFTEKAAGELKLRLRSELEKARSVHLEQADEAVVDRLETGLSHLEEAHIGTIHGFCADLLKQRPLQARVDPLFVVASEEEKTRLYRREFDRWLQEKLADPPDGVRRLLRRKASWEDGPVDVLFRAGRSLIELRDFPTPWEIRPIDREQRIDDLIERLLSVSGKVDQAENKRDKLYENFAGVRSLLTELQRFEASGGRRDYDSLEHRIPSLNLGRHKGRGYFGRDATREDILAEREALRDEFAEFRKVAGADLAAHLQRELQELIERYQRVKLTTGRIDFLDLLVSARDLIRDNDELRVELQNRFTHLFVDEFQDTDPLQAEILLLLSARDPGERDWMQIVPKPGKLFIVADPKQSIYRFRRADVTLYQRIKKQLCEGGALPLYLTVSYRSSPEIQEFINVAMNAAMKKTGDNHQAEYVPLVSHRTEIDGQPAVVALPIPKPYSNWGYLTNYSIQLSEPKAVGSWIKWLVEESGWQVSSRSKPGRTQPIGPSDVCLLFRRFVAGGKDITRPYVDELQRLDVPHLLLGGRGFHQREEIVFMRSALTAIERPDDELSVFATLRGPLFSISDEHLLLFRQRYRSLHPFRRLKLSPEDGTNGDGLPSWERDITQALQILAGLHQRRNHRPIALTIRELLDETRAQAGFALWQSGDQVLANVMRLLQLSRNYESSGGLSFRGFVEQLELSAEKGEGVEQPILEEGVEGVRLMTVHSAKGLEFPVVILCDITYNTPKTPSRWIDPEKRAFAIRLAGGSPWELIDHEDEEIARDQAESLRLLYVATTRARDILVVPAVADAPEREGWLSALTPALFPPGQNYRFPMVGPGVPTFTGTDTVLDRSPRSPIPPDGGIRPGLHKPQIGAHRVVWWDPTTVDLERKTKPGIRRHIILQEHPGYPDERTEPGAKARLQWVEQHQVSRKRGSAASHSVTTATQVSTRASRQPHEPSPEGPAARALLPESVADILVEECVRELSRPSGKSFGSLVHELMSRIPFTAEQAEIILTAKALGRLFGNPPEEIDASVRAVETALEHSLILQAAAAESHSLPCWREAPVGYRDGDVIVEGVVDLMFLSDNRWHVVDFKTDLRIDLELDTYKRQVAIYARAIAAASGKPVQAHLLFL